MDVATTAGHQFKIGVGLCWLSWLTLPIGLLAIGGGPCAGPRNIAGSIILLVVGSAAVVAAAVGVYRTVKLFRQVRGKARWFGLASAVLVSPVILVAVFYLLVGVLSLNAYMD